MCAVRWRARTAASCAPFCGAQGEGELGKRLLARDGLLHLAGRLKADDWMDRRGVQLEIDDGADARKVA